MKETHRSINWEFRLIAPGEFRKSAALPLSLDWVSSASPVSISDRSSVPWSRRSGTTVYALGDGLPLGPSRHLAEHHRRGCLSYSPTRPSIDSRSISAWPARRAVSSIRRSSTHRKEKCAPFRKAIVDIWSRDFAPDTTWRLRSQASR